MKQNSTADPINILFAVDFIKYSCVVLILGGHLPCDLPCPSHSHLCHPHHHHHHHCHSEYSDFHMMY